MVLVADGRSGSYITSAVLSTLTGSCPPKPPEMELDEALDKNVCWLELFGGHAGTALEIKDPLARMTSFLSQVAREHANSTLVGFQWKTFKNQYMKTRTREYKAAWEYLGKHNIRALHLTRNPLDEFLSECKHFEHRNLPPHCDPDDDACLKAMLAPYAVDVDALFKHLEGYDKAQRWVLDDLSTSKLNYMNVTYDSLIDNDNDATQLSAWQSVLDFLGVLTNVTKPQLDEAFMASATTHNDQGSNVENWGDIVDALHQRDDGHFAYHIDETLIAQPKTGSGVRNWEDVVKALLNRNGGRYAYLLTEKILEQLRGRRGAAAASQRPPVWTLQ